MGLHWGLDKTTALTPGDYQCSIRTTFLQFISPHTSCRLCPPSETWPRCLSTARPALRKQKSTGTSVHCVCSPFWVAKSMGGTKASWRSNQEGVVSQACFHAHPKSYLRVLRVITEEQVCPDTRPGVPLQPQTRMRESRQQGYSINIHQPASSSEEAQGGNRFWAL